MKGQGLAQLLTEKSNSHAVNLASEHESHILHIDEDHEWYKDIIYFLRNLSCPDYLIDHQRRAVRLKAEKYILTRDGLGFLLINTFQNDSIRISPTNTILS